MMVRAAFGNLPLFAPFYSVYYDTPLIKVSSRTGRFNGDGEVMWFSKSDPVIFESREVDYV
jgi:hypothetical protein